VKAGIPLDPAGPPGQLSQGDVALLGLAAYTGYHHYQSALTLDPAPLANHLLALARGLGRVYARQSIRNGPAGFQFAVARTFGALEKGMATLGLFALKEV
jgi:hypothetical protein